MNIISFPFGGFTYIDRFTLCHLFFFLKNFIHLKFFNQCFLLAHSFHIPFPSTKKSQIKIQNKLHQFQVPTFFVSLSFIFFFQLHSVTKFTEIAYRFPLCHVQSLSIHDFCSHQHKRRIFRVPILIFHASLNDNRRFSNLWYNFWRGCWMCVQLLTFTDLWS